MLLLFIHLIHSAFVIFISHDAIAILHIVFKEYLGKCFNCVSGWGNVFIHLVRWNEIVFNMHVCITLDTL